MSFLVIYKADKICNACDNLGLVSFENKERNWATVTVNGFEKVNKMLIILCNVVDLIGKVR